MFTSATLTAVLLAVFLVGAVPARAIGPAASSLSGLALQQLHELDYKPAVAFARQHYQGAGLGQLQVIVQVLAEHHQASDTKIYSNIIDSILLGDQAGALVALGAHQDDLTRLLVRAALLLKQHDPAGAAQLAQRLAGSYGDMSADIAATTPYIMLALQDENAGRLLADLALAERDDPARVSQLLAVVNRIYFREQEQLLQQLTAYWQVSDLAGHKSAIVALLGQLERAQQLLQIMPLLTSSARLGEAIVAISTLQDPQAEADLLRLIEKSGQATPAQWVQIFGVVPGYLEHLVMRSLCVVFPAKQFLLSDPVVLKLSEAKFLALMRGVSQIPDLDFWRLQVADLTAPQSLLLWHRLDKLRADALSTRAFLVQFASRDMAAYRAVVGRLLLTGKDKNDCVELLFPLLLKPEYQSILQAMLVDFISQVAMPMRYFELLNILPPAAALQILSDFRKGRSAVSRQLQLAQYAYGYTRDVDLCLARYDSEQNELVRSLHQDMLMAFARLRLFERLRQVVAGAFMADSDLEGEAFAVLSDANVESSKLNSHLERLYRESPDPATKARLLTALANQGPAVVPILVKILSNY